jgi:hypothetical protein
VQRALIDYDFGASGIWIVTSNEETFRTPERTDVSGWRRSVVNGTKRARPWSEHLSNSLLDELQRWNDWGCTLATSPIDSHAHDAGWDSFYQDARGLAGHVQSELGRHWQVLWAENGAWNFARSPWQFDNPE